MFRVVLADSRRCTPRPVLRPAPTRRVTEEQSPSIPRSMPAVAAGRDDPRRRGEREPGAEPTLVSAGRLRYRAVLDARRRARCRARPPKKYAGVVALVGIATFAVFSSGRVPAPCAVGAAPVSRSVQAVAPDRIEVTPGIVSVPKGADQAIDREPVLVGAAGPDGAEVDRRALRARAARAGRGSVRGNAVRSCRLARRLRRSRWRRSATYRLNVVDMSYAQKLELEDHFR